MILPDLNVLLYAYNPHTRQHKRASSWWENTISGTELIGLPHEITLGFVHIATHPKLGKASVNLEAARDVVLSWLDLPQARVLLPSPDHTRKVIDLMKATDASGALASDASLAVYAMDNRATLYSNDTDFARFPGLDWKNPI
jgi:toxin-antitoxin system PIN domain toxin